MSSTLIPESAIQALRARRASAPSAQQPPADQTGMTTHNSLVETAVDSQRRTSSTPAVRQTTAAPKHSEQNLLLRAVDKLIAAMSGLL